jgi:tubulin alpha
MSEEFSAPPAPAKSATTYLVTGASSGLGLEFVNQLAARTGEHRAHVFATCRKKISSASGVDRISSVKPAEGNLVTILEGIDVTTDECKNKLIECLTEANCENIDVVIHNAGGMGSNDKASQSFENATSQMMLDTANLNAVGPLRVQQALHSKGYMGGPGSSGGKVVVITSGMSSIGDNGSGGFYAYRGSKALVNMVAKSLSVDLKPKGISVMALAPGFVATEFGGFGQENMSKMGAITSEKSVGQMIQAIDELCLETTGRFMSVDKNSDVPKEFGPGW